VEPAGAGGEAPARREGDTASRALRGLGAGVVLVYSALFAIGELLLGRVDWARFAAVALVAAGVVYLQLSRRGFETLVE